MTLINETRTASGLSALAVDAELADYADGWARHVAETFEIEHSDFGSLVGVRWSQVGENIGWGFSPEAIHSWLMNSRLHRANIMWFAYTHLGVATYYNEQGVLFVVEIFATARTGGGTRPR